MVGSVNQRLLQSTTLWRLDKDQYPQMYPSHILKRVPGSTALCPRILMTESDMKYILDAWGKD